MCELRAASAAAWTAVKAGATTISTSMMSFTALFSSLTNTTASCTVLYIFQLPAMNGIRIRGCYGMRGWRGWKGRRGRNFPSRPSCPSRLSRPLRKRDDAGQSTAREKLEGRATSSRNVRDPIGHARLFHRRNRVAPADDRRALDARDGARDGVGANRERCDLENAHRSVPHHRLRVGDRFFVRFDRRPSDVDAKPIADPRVGHLEHLVC